MEAWAFSEFSWGRVEGSKTLVAWLGVWGVSYCYLVELPKRSCEVSEVVGLRVNKALAPIVRTYSGHWPFPYWPMRPDERGT